MQMKFNAYGFSNAAESAGERFVIFEDELFDSIQAARVLAQTSYLEAADVIVEVSD